jgi:mono/diheme cytochrome c family protein
MQPIKRMPPLLLALALALLAAACAPAPAPAAQPAAPSPTPLSLPTSAPAVSSSSSSSSSSSAAEVPPAAAGDELSGASLYQVSCAACHGSDRAGNSFDMDGQKIDVPSLAWTDLSATYAAQPARGSVEQQLAMTITKGQDESGEDLNAMMPRWSSLSDAQVQSLVDFLKTADSSSGETALSPAASNLMGQQLFDAACAACHGADGAGKSFEMDGNKIDTPALSWSDLSATYATDASRGTVEQQLALAITKGQDESGDQLEPMMPQWSFLSQAQVDSLIQYIQASFK